MNFVFRKKILWIAAAFSILMAGCSGLNSQPTLTPTIQLPTSTITPTINWFPATNTPTFLPTQRATPTLVVLPGLGSLILDNAFSSQDKWNIAVNIAGQGNVTGSQLTLSIPDGSQGSTITALLKDFLTADSFARVTVRLSLCKGRDQVGFLFRATSPQDFYRFSITCSGETRLERVVGGQPFVIRDWAPSPDAPLGAPGEVTMGVSTAGQNLEFFLDDRFQFSIQDSVFTQGGVGFYLKASSDSPVTVSLTNLEAYQELPTQAAPIPSATP